MASFKDTHPVLSSGGIVLLTVSLLAGVPSYLLSQKNDADATRTQNTQAVPASEVTPDPNISWEPAPINSYPDYLVTPGSNRPSTQIQQDNPIEAPAPDATVVPPVVDAPPPYVQDVIPAKVQPRGARVEDIKAELNALLVNPKLPLSDFKDESFGPFYDIDADICGSFEESVLRYASRAARDENCVVREATVVDPYTGKMVQWVNGSGGLVVADNFVSSRDMWASGGRDLSQQMRVAALNDQLNIVPVFKTTWEDKGFRSADQWLPTNDSFRCSYVSTQILVKKKYNLWVDQAEKKTMSGILDSCGDKNIGIAAPVSGIGGDVVAIDNGVVLPQ